MCKRKGSNLIYDSVLIILPLLVTYKCPNTCKTRLEEVPFSAPGLQNTRLNRFMSLGLPS